MARQAALQPQPLKNLWKDDDPPDDDYGGMCH
jgi:hypothetical protein